MRILVLLFMVLFTVNVFSQTFQKAIYKHANDINDGRGITNRYLFSDSVGTTKWHHSISVEAQLHNNYLYKSDYLKVVTYYKNSFLGDSTNESGYLPSYKIYTSFYNRKFTFSIGASYSIYQFTSDYPDSRTELWRYKIMSMHFMSGLFKSYKNLLINYIIEFIPSLALNEYHFHTGISHSFTPLNKLHLSSGFGVVVDYKLYKSILISASTSSRFTLKPFERPLFSWINYSSINFGIGLKYNFK